MLGSENGAHDDVQGRREIFAHGSGTADSEKKVTLWLSLVLLLAGEASELEAMDPPTHLRGLTTPRRAQVPPAHLPRAGRVVRRGEKFRRR